jgi:hypothetical protein
MAKTSINVDDEYLAAAREVLGTQTEEETVNAALRGRGNGGSTPGPGSPAGRRPVGLAGRGGKARTVAIARVHRPTGQFVQDVIDWAPRRRVRCTSQLMNTWFRLFY